MSAEFDKTRFHERKDVQLQLPSITERKRITDHLESLGCVVDYESDYAYLPRDTSGSPWQASDVTQVDFFLNREPAAYPSPVDRLNFIYLLATLPEGTIPLFVSTIQSCISEFGGELTLEGKHVAPEELLTIFRGYVAELRDELASDPGSDFVAKMLYEFKPRA